MVKLSSTFHFLITDKEFELNFSLSHNWQRSCAHQLKERLLVSGTKTLCWTSHPVHIMLWKCPHNLWKIQHRYHRHNHLVLVSRESTIVSAWRRVSAPSLRAPSAAITVLSPPAVPLRKNSYHNEKSCCSTWEFLLLFFGWQCWLSFLWCQSKH